MRTLLAGLPCLSTPLTPGTLQRDPGMNLTGLNSESLNTGPAVVPALKLILLPLGWGCQERGRQEEPLTA